MSDELEDTKSVGRVTGDKPVHEIKVTVGGHITTLRTHDFSLVIWFLQEVTRRLTISGLMEQVDSRLTYQNRIGSITDEQLAQARKKLQLLRAKEEAPEKEGDYFV